MKDNSGRGTAKSSPSGENIIYLDDYVNSKIAEDLTWERQLREAGGHGEVRTLADMTEEEISAIEELYQCKVIRPK